MAGAEGLEPSARGFGDRCSINWAIPLYGGQNGSWTHLFSFADWYLTAWFSAHKKTDAFHHFQRAGRKKLAVGVWIKVLQVSLNILSYTINTFDMERQGGVEPPSWVWKTQILTVIRLAQIIQDTFVFTAGFAKFAYRPHLLRQMGLEPINCGWLFTKENCCVCLTSEITIKTRHYLELTIYQLIYFHSGMKSGSRTHAQSLNFEFAVNVFFFFTLLLYQKFFKFSNLQ